MIPLILFLRVCLCQFGQYALFLLYTKKKQSMKNWALGVDVGGSHITCAAVDLDGRSLVNGSISETDVDNKAPADTILDAWASVLNQTLERLETNFVAGIGLGMPGPFEYHRGVARFSQVEKYYSLNGIDVDRELSARISIGRPVPLRFMNDASAFAAGEAWAGSASGVQRSISITLGTGFGSAFISNGIPVVAGNEVPNLGCVWHLPYRDSIADDYFSTRWLVKRYRELTGSTVNGAKAIADEAPRSAPARQVFLEYGNNMGEFFSPWLRKFGAEVLVVGGNITGAYPLFGPAFEEALRNNGADTRIRLSALKEHAAILGSARMLDASFWKELKPVLPLM